MNDIITDVVGRMASVLENGQMDKLKIVLTKVLSGYDIKEKPHEIATCGELNSQYLIKFLAWKATEGKSKNTLKQYRFVIGKMLESMNKPVPEITEEDLFLYIAYAKHNGASNRYLNNIRLELSSFFGWLYSKSMISHNPISGISCIKTEKVIKSSFSDVEMDMMRRTLTSKRDVALFEFLYATGLRVSELCSVRLPDVDFGSKSVKVLGKGSKERVVFLTATAIWHLKQYLQERGYEDGPLFLNPKKNGISSCGVWKIMHRISEKSGVANVHPHRFRRTLATNLLKKGMPIEEVSRILGHSKLDTTMLYCNIDTETVRSNYTRIMTA